MQHSVFQWTCWLRGGLVRFLPEAEMEMRMGDGVATTSSKVCSATGHYGVSSGLHNLIYSTLHIVQTVIKADDCKLVLGLSLRLL